MDGVRRGKMGGEVRRRKTRGGGAGRKREQVVRKRQRMWDAHTLGTLTYLSIHNITTM